ncbi:hypothetical protein BaRGS_00033245 [Batillaria attramentaria]|uniref:Uncharacterized protein n=1 Tax=Batillaria attramentaria TaxID=370345 RepID=A0ABD0JKF8_9CAEN
MVGRLQKLPSQEVIPALHDLDVGACPTDHVTPRSESTGFGQHGARLRERGRHNHKATLGEHRAVSRSGSLPLLEPIQPSATNLAVPRLSLEPMDSLPASPAAIRRADSWMSVGSCSSRRMNSTPRLPPIGGTEHVTTLKPTSQPQKRSPRDLDKDATGIDPVLCANEDPTDVRMLGRRRNAVVTSTPRSADSPA